MSHNRRTRAAAAAARYGQDHIVMQIEFPKDYPHQPFFVRVVSPR
jgi:ubiquitin-protein ligase